jgi:gamma-glutamylcyclotransferase (GGCT)/AIG2-like uncharacterized protein YtfP
MPPVQPLPSPSAVFVYGSLKRGQANHHLLAEAPFLGEAQLEGLALHDLGPFPMAVVEPGAGPLHGELYAVTPEQLSQLDRLEGVPRLYRREAWPLPSGAAVWVYLGQSRQVRHSPLLAAGRWGAPLAAALLLLAALPASAGDTRRD